MKKSRIAALFLVLVMVLSVAAAASAGTNSLKLKYGEKPIQWNSYRMIENKETVSFFISPDPWGLYEKCGEYYDQYSDVLYDCEGAVSGKTNVNWIHLTPAGNDFMIVFDVNKSTRTRTGKITVTGKNYKATLNITQFSADCITSAKRKGNKVIVKLQKGTAPVHGLWIEQCHEDEEGSSYKYMYDGPFKGTKYTFTVKPGYIYYVGYGPMFLYEWGYSLSSTASAYFYVESTSGSETYEVYNFCR